MLRILGKPTSINVRKVLWLCHEMNLPYELEAFGIGFQSTDTPEFRALNPNAAVPVIQDGDFTLWESNSICRYLAAEHGRVDLLPADPRERARVERWMDWQIAELNPAWSYAFMALVKHSPIHTDRSAVDASVLRWNRQMTILDGQLQITQAHAAGAEFTLADIVLGLSTHRWFMTPIDRPELRAVSAYYERLGERPAFRLHGRNGMP